MSDIDVLRAEPGTPLQRLVVQRMFDQGLTLEAVARRGGLSVASVAALRSGGRGKRPRRDTLERLARGLDLDFQEVLTAAVAIGHSSDEQLILQYFRQLNARDRARVVAQLAQMAAAERQGP